MPRLLWCMLLALATGQANENQGVIQGKVTRVGGTEAISDVQILRVSYISDIRQGDISIYDNGLVVGSSAPEPVDVLVSSGAQSIRGKTQGADGKPVASATVVLVPPQARRQNALLYRTIRADRNGDFSLNNVPPGEYKLFVWENVPNTAYMNSRFMEKYEARGRSITVSAGSNLSFDVTVIPAEK